MRDARRILLVALAGLGCSGAHLHVGDDRAGGGFAGVGGGHAGGGEAGAGVASAGGSAGGVAGAAAGGSAGTGGTSPATGGTAGATLGTAGAGGIAPGDVLPRFLVLDPGEASPSYTVLLNGASDDGSVLVGSSMYQDAATSSQAGHNFYWSAASGVVKIDPPSQPAHTIGLWPNVSPDGSTVFGTYDSGLYAWTQQGGYQFFPENVPVPPGPTANVESAVSRDGAVMWGVAWQSNTVYRPFRWRRTDGVVYGSSIASWPSDGIYADSLQSSSCGGCGILPGSSPFSDDAAVVAGYHYPKSTAAAVLVQGFIWLEPGTLVELGPMPGTAACSVSALARDGSAAFGGCTDDAAVAAGQLPKAFRWTAAAGMVSIGDGIYRETTRDGQVAMGGNDTDTLFRWTVQAGAVRLQPSPGEIDLSRFTLRMTTRNLSDDGQALYGRAVRTDFQSMSEGETPEQGFRWTAAGGFALLDLLPGHDYGAVTAASPDGSVQVGVTRTTIGNPTPVPAASVLWDCRGVRDIRAELSAGGIDLQGMKIDQTLRVWSGASIMIVGYGGTTDTRPWIAWLPRRC
jgi:hypothetical protein